VVPGYQRVVIFDPIKSAVDFAKHLPRYREIVGALWKYGFADVLRLLEPPTHHHLACEKNPKNINCK
jgi:hypothetical protein